MTGFVSNLRERRGKKRTKKPYDPRRARRVAPVDTRDPEPPEVKRKMMSSAQRY